MNRKIRSIIFCALIIPISAFLKLNELKLSIDLTKELRIRHCVLIKSENVNENKEKFILSIKNYSSESILISFLNSEDLVTFILENQEPYRTGLIFNEKNVHVLNRILKFLEKAKQAYKMARYSWLVILSGPDAVIPISGDVPIPFDCEFIVITKQLNSTYALTEYYNIKNSSFFFDLGAWNTRFGLKIVNSTFDARRSNLHRCIITIMTFKKVPCTGREHPICEVYEILYALSDALNFTINRSLTKMSDNPSKKLNTFADIADTLVLLDPDFHLYDKFGPIFTYVINWYIKYPHAELRADYYLQPFSSNLWVALLSAIFFTTISVIIIHILIQHEKPIFIDNLFLGIETFCNQCGNDDIKNISMRIICISLRATALIFIGAYGATITSYVAVEIMKPPFTNAKEFVENGQYKLETVQSGHLHVYLNRSNDPVLKNVYHNFTIFHGPYDYPKLFKGVCYKKSAVDSLVNYITVIDRACALFKITEPIGVVWTVLYMQKNSPFTKAFNKKYIRIHETGIKKKIENLLYFSDPLWISDEQFQPIKNDQMIQVLSIPFVGIALALLVIITEVIVKRRRLKNSNGIEWYRNGIEWYRNWCRMLFEWFRILSEWNKTSP